MVELYDILCILLLTEEEYIENSNLFNYGSGGFPEWLQ